MRPMDMEPADIPVNEEELEALYWEFDHGRSKKQEGERLLFKCLLRGFARKLAYKHASDVAGDIGSGTF